MAKSVSEEELQLKKRARRRLIGAIALVAAVTAVLPMILDSEPKPGPQDISIQIPAPEPKGATVAKMAPPAVPPPASKAEASGKPAADKPEAKLPAAAATDAAAKGAAQSADNPNDVALSRPQKAAPDKTRAKPPEKSVEKTVEKAPAAAAAPKAGPGAFFIQVIALSETEKAKQVQQKISGAGVRAYTESVSAGGGQVTRVRAGPFATREEADKAQARLQSLGFEGKVAAY